MILNFAPYLACYPYFGFSLNVCSSEPWQLLISLVIHVGRSVTALGKNTPTASRRVLSIDSLCDLASSTRAGTKAITLTTNGSIQNLSPMEQLATPVERVEPLHCYACRPHLQQTVHGLGRTVSVQHLATLYMRRTEGHPVT